MGKENWENVRKEKVSDEKEKLFSIAACGRHVSTAVSFSIGSIENGDQSKTIAAGTTEKVMVAEGATPTFTFVPDTETTESAIEYAVAEVIVDGMPVGEQDSYTFEEIAEAGHSLAVTFEKAIYDEESRFEFPIDGRTKTLEAERFQLFNIGENETWSLQITSKDWASGKKFVNAMNRDDQIRQTVLFGQKKAKILVKEM